MKIFEFGTLFRWAVRTISMRQQIFSALKVCGSNLLAHFKHAATNF
jgi:hypothetical protein